MQEMEGTRWVGTPTTRRPALSARTVSLQLDSESLGLADAGSKVAMLHILDRALETPRESAKQPQSAAATYILFWSTLVQA